MNRFFAVCLILVLMAGYGCTKSHSALNKALTAAVKDKKLSEKKMHAILAEHEFMLDGSHEKTGEYVERIVKTIDMGGDSTHIDVVRHQILGKPKGV